VSLVFPVKTSVLTLPEAAFQDMGKMPCVHITRRNWRHACKLKLAVELDRISLR
jgi:hypothetical protein